ncbi:MAG: DNA ligase D [Hyphomicrobiales bacterium]|nr:DNA ligase D [Hyphomicrobiales bacterium]
MALEAYRKKRHFGTTSEPRGKVKKTAGEEGGSYVVQKHDARRLHYDFRLEMDGVLKSWAVTRGPSLVPGEKRLAVHVEDHPLEYGDFEGTIPKGEYGGGTVILWDRGRWEPLGDPHRGYAKGHLDFELQGEKLHGRWHLVRMAGRAREKRENWLLIKGDDEAARPAGAPDILEERPESVKTGRVVEEVAGERPGWSSKTGRIAPAAAEEASSKNRPVDPAKLKKAKKAPFPSFVEPTLATLVDEPASGKRFVHEIKFDGYRLQARIDGARVRLLTRSGLDWASKFGNSLIEAFKALPLGKALIDGELVVENENGASDFSALQADLSEGRQDRFVFYAFDLIYLDGYDIRAAPLLERKRALASLFAVEHQNLRLSDHFEQGGKVILDHVCRLGLEGIVSKLRDAPYRSGRSRDWLKAKCSSRQEFIICGFVPSTTSRKAIGSLVLGYYSGGKLVHAGRVGTGFTRAVAEDLFARLETIRAPSSPFAERLSADAARQVRFVRPELVCEIEFRGWTADRNLRHSAFRGLREDKPAKEVVEEAAMGKASRKAVSGENEKRGAKNAPSRTSKVKLTHPDRVYWPDVGVTKEGLADYYSQVWPRIGPFVTKRPLALVRCPAGVSGECFFQKHAWKGLNRAIRLARDPQDSSGEPILSIDDLDGLIALVQAAVLEIHPWGSTLARLEDPDMIIMDLDPGETVSWAQVVEAANEVRDRLSQFGLASFVKTSGGKGLHVVSPLRPKANWEMVKSFCKGVADQMTADSPNRFIATITKSKRRGKVLVDYLRNGRGATAVAAYSTRARPGAAVSMPLGWEEIGSVSGAAYFTVGNAVTRLAHVRSDPWEDFHRAAVPLPASNRRKTRSA